MVRPVVVKTMERLDVALDAERIECYGLDFGGGPGYIVVKLRNGMTLALPSDQATVLDAAGIECEWRVLPQLQGNTV